MFADTFAFAMKVATSLGFIRSAFLSSCLRLYEIRRVVLCAFPLFVARIKVFIISASYFCEGGRRIATKLCSLGIPRILWLDWSSIPAWGVGDPGFKSQRPHHNPVSQNKDVLGHYCCKEVLMLVFLRRVVMCSQSLM